MSTISKFQIISKNNQKSLVKMAEVLNSSEILLGFEVTSIGNKLVLVVQTEKEAMEYKVIKQKDMKDFIINLKPLLNYADKEDINCDIESLLEELETVA